MYSIKFFYLHCQTGPKNVLNRICFWALAITGAKPVGYATSSGIARSFGD
jgi:hypothetical protein